MRGLVHPVKRFLTITSEEELTMYTIICTRPDGADLDRCIDGFLVRNALGGTNYMMIDAVIAMLDRGVRFFTEVRGVRVEVVARNGARRRYVTTLGDGFPPNNLLRLPPC